MKRKSRVQINYKSGQSVVIDCNDFKVSWSQVTGEVTKLTWSDASPNPLMAGLSSIESIWELP